MKKRYIALVIGLILCLAGGAGWLYQIQNGLSVTGLSNPFSWGLYMGTFEFFIGVSSGGMLLFSIAYLFRVEELMPFTKLSAVASLASVGAAGVAILTDLGKPFRVLQMLLTPNIGSPLFWDVVVLGIYAVLCLAAAVIQILPDSRKNRGDRSARLTCEKRSRAISFFALPFVAVMNAVTTLMFAVQNTREWWHSAILPADSVAVATALGLSFMMLLCLLTAGKDGLSEYSRAFSLIAKISAVAILVHLCFTALELIPLAWNQSAESRHLLELLFGTYGLLYGLELVLPLLAMIIYAARGGGGKWLLAAANGMVIAGMFIHRMMLLLPAFNSIPLTIPVAGLSENRWSYPVATGMFKPGQDVFTTFWNYVPTPAELCVNLLPFGLVIAVVAGAMILFPMASGRKQG